MTWTYGPDFALARDRIRFLVGDTDIEDPLVQDEEVALYAAGGAFAQSSDYAAAAMVADGIAAKFGRQVQSTSAGGATVVFDIAQGRAKFFRDLAGRLRSLVVGGSAAPYLGGLKWSDRDAREADSDRVAPYFDRDRPSDGTRSWR